MKLYIITAVLLLLAGCSSSETAVVNKDKSNHVLEFQYLGELPSFNYNNVYHAKSPCKLFLMTDSTLDSIQGLRVRRRYVTVCHDDTATLTEYDVKIR